MKSIRIVLFLFLLGVISCSRDTVIPQEADTIQHPITFQASLPEPDGGATKAGFGVPKASAYSVLWENTDVAAVTVDYGATSVSACITPSDNAKVGTFTATLGAPTSGTFTVQAVVPEWALVSYNTSARDITLNVPASQTPSATGPDPKAIQLVASQELDAVPSADTPVELPFHHATAYGCISLTNLPTNAEINSIDLIFSVPVSGKWNYKPSDGSMTADVPANIITLHTSSASNVFFGCAPTNLEGAVMTVRLTTKAGVFETDVTFSAEHVFTAGRLSSFSVSFAGVSAKRSIKLLSIGNSFSNDAHQYLLPILLGTGNYDEVILGNIAIGGCSLQIHVTNPIYAYYKKTSTENKYMEKRLLTVLDDEDWDYITLQQNSGNSGDATTYVPYLEQLIDMVREHRPKAKLLWHMTWAYQQNSTDSGFVRYNNNQLTMYNAIVSVVKEVVLTTGAFGDVLPAGTVIQNLRTSPLGDTITRDGCHLSYKIGCYSNGLEWLRVLSGIQLTEVPYTPTSYTYTDDEISYILFAVETASRRPFLIWPYGGPDPGADPGPGPTPSDPGDPVDFGYEITTPDFGDENW